MCERHLLNTNQGNAGYQALFLQAYQPHMTEIDQPAKFWQGAPTAALRRSLLALGSGRLHSFDQGLIKNLMELRILHYTAIEGVITHDLRSGNPKAQTNPGQYKDPEYAVDHEMSPIKKDNYDTDDSDLDYDSNPRTPQRSLKRKAKSYKGKSKQKGTKLCTNTELPRTQHPWVLAQI
ncbi:hypothetical protein N7454_007970 [Penicillium verhagenii]|nr:hypothetical protein N7454_007970 [Penicillium verhagenii]